MASHTHKQLASEINQLSQIPQDNEAFTAWLDGSAHLAFLEKNAQSDEILTHALGDTLFIQSVVLPTDRLQSLDYDDVLNWDRNPYGTSIASYGQRNFDDIFIERGFQGGASKTLRDAIPLLFIRDFGARNPIYELNQEYSHVTQTHWVPEQDAYCRKNDDGKLNPIVSLTVRDTANARTVRMSFQWPQLEEYLMVINAALVRMFDFTLYRPSEFPGWGNKPPHKVYETETLFYRQRIVQDKASYFRGAQIIRPRTPKRSIFNRIMGNTPSG